MFPAKNFTPPSLADLTTRFLARPSESPSDAAVEPHEQPSGFTTEPRSAWAEATAVLAFWGGADRSPKMPADWGTFTRQAADANFLPMAIGHFPQQVRDVSALLLKKSNSQPSETHGWTASDPLLAAASERVAGRYEDSERLLNKVEGVSETLLANERAVLAWAKGDRSTAERIWNALPECGPVCFNRGIAALAAGRNAEAATAFDEAAKFLPEASGWHHLANLYRVLAR